MNTTTLRSTTIAALLLGAAQIASASEQSLDNALVATQSSIGGFIWAGAATTLIIVSAALFLFSDFNESEEGGTSTCDLHGSIEQENVSEWIQALEPGWRWQEPKKEKRAACQTGGRVRFQQFRTH